jgi:prepilin-type N-terminal cleavage/methylation domain-containing protein
MVRLMRRRAAAMRSRREESGRGGFTLLEVMIALTLMAFGVLSLAALQLLVMDYSARGRSMTQASAIAQARMEQLERLTWTDAAMQPTGGAFTGPTTVNVTVEDGAGGGIQQSYDIYVRVADLVVGVTRSIDVRVDWDEPDRPGRTYALSTIRYNVEGL